MYICSLFVPHAKTTELIQPREGTFYDPAPLSQPATVLRVAHCEQRMDAAATQGTTDLLRVVRPVPEDTSRPAARPTKCALERRNVIEQW